MLYARVDLETKEILEFPIYMKEIIRRLRENNISLPRDIRPVDLTHFGYYGVKPTQERPHPPDGYRAIIGMPVWEDNELVRRWQMIPVGGDFAIRLWQRVRARRDKILRETDWTELPSVRRVRSAEWAELWDKYRQELRDITNVPYPTLAIIPRKPNETE